MKKENTQPISGKKRVSSKLFFLFAVAACYGILFIPAPNKVITAISNSVRISFNIIIPLGFAFIFLFSLNLFFKPVHIVKILGNKSGLKGVMFSIVAGFISMGPIFVWYPLLKELREKGAGNVTLSVFLGNRAVKPFLLPVMISYFGCIYVAILTILTILGSIFLGFILDTLMKITIQK